MATNVQIPIDNAGIGDAIAIKNNTTGEDKSHFICVVGSTVTATPPSGCTWYGTVYGRERGGLMIRSFTPTSAKWASTTEGGVSLPLNSTEFANVIANTTDNAGEMRNGASAYGDDVIAMSKGEVASRNEDSTTTHLHPDSPQNGSGNYPMGEANFNADTNGAKTMYGTYENYISQLLPIMKGSASGVFGKRCGKQNTKELANNNADNGHYFIAAQYAYGRYVANENFYHWWLPDMYELAVMMSDNSFEKCQYAHSVIGGNTARATARWSSVRYSDSRAWHYHQYGFSTNRNYYYSFTVCPVTLIPL